MSGKKGLIRYFSGMGRREFLNWMSDEQYIKIQYRLKTGKKLNLKNPQSFNEKMQWLKLHDRNPLYTTVADKAAVKPYVAGILGEQYIIPTLGIWKHADKIDFDTLPDQFVLKCNHDSASVIICRDKSQFDWKQAVSLLEKRLRHTGYWYGREWPYKNIKPCILAEPYMEEETGHSGLTDYKFFCFNGEPKMIYVSVGLENHSTAQISFYDLTGKEMPFHRADYKQMEEELVLPDTFPEMIQIAGRLASEINNPFTRIDLYSIKGQIYFSEITFYPCNGMIPFAPAEWDFELGKWIQLEGCPLE